MEGILASLWVKLDVLAAQIINLLILFFAFKYLLGDKLSAALQERKDKLAKLDQAEAAYDALIAKANDDRDTLIAAGTASKKKLIEEAKQLAESKRDEIVAAAQHEAHIIKTQAEQKNKAQSTELYAQFETMVKKTALAGLKKLIPSKADMYEQYLDEISLK